MSCYDCGVDKYRVLPCKTFISVGNCPYRDRCVYVHDPRVGSKAANKTSTRRKNKEDNGADAFFWPTMPISKGGPQQRKPNAIQNYAVESAFPGSAVSHLAVHSMWEHFVDVCRGAPALNATQSRSVHSGRKRLCVFLKLASGESVAPQISPSSSRHPTARCLGFDTFLPVSVPSHARISPPPSPYSFGKSRLRSELSPVSIAISDTKRYSALPFPQLASF